MAQLLLLAAGFCPSPAAWPTCCALDHSPNSQQMDNPQGTAVSVPGYTRYVEREWTRASPLTRSPTLCTMYECTMVLPGGGRNDHLHALLWDTTAHSQQTLTLCELYLGPILELGLEVLLGRGDEGKPGEAWGIRRWGAKEEEPVQGGRPGGGWRRHHPLAKAPSTQGLSDSLDLT